MRRRRRTSSRSKMRSSGSPSTRSWSGTRRCTVAGRPSANVTRPQQIHYADSDSHRIRMTILGIDTIAVVVSDPVKAFAWYRDVLGLDLAYIGTCQPVPDT